jgi:hypothetical protein
LLRRHGSRLGPRHCEELSGRRARFLLEYVRERLKLDVQTVLPIHGRMVKVDELKLEAGVPAN